MNYGVVILTVCRQYDHYVRQKPDSEAAPILRSEAASPSTDRVASGLAAKLEGSFGRLFSQDSVAS